MVRQFVTGNIHLKCIRKYFNKSYRKVGYNNDIY